jgi:hypothetical protein
MSIRFIIQGRVRDGETGAGVPGLFVKAYDKDLLFDDLLGSAITGADGSFDIISESSDFRNFFEARPDLYLRVFYRDRVKEIWSSKDAVRWSAGRYECFDVLLPTGALEGRGGPSIALVGDTGEARTEYQPGEALVLRAAGLRPRASHTITISDEDGEIVTQTILSDAKGEVRDAVIWPQIGLDDPRDRTDVPVEKARERWLGRSIAFEIRDGERSVGRSLVAIAAAKRPLAVATDAAGVLRNGFEVGKGDAHLTLFDFDGWESARIWMVPRQHDWRAGDRIAPVFSSKSAKTDKPSERLAYVDVRPAGNVYRVLVATRDDLAPGAYDFIIRRLRHGYEDDDDLFLRATDIVTSRRATGLVVREPFMASKIIRGGCINLQQIAARRTLGNGWPYVQYTDTFQVGEDVWGALDPLALDPEHASKMVAVYVVPHKSAAEWSDDNTLANLPVLGGNPGVQKWLTQSYCINANLRLLWPSASLPGDYDIVADFGNNSGDPSTFTSDAQYNMPLDIIDGYVVPGFRVVSDPTIDTSIPHAGVFSYDETTQGYVDVIDDLGGAWHVPLKANIHFPADVAGATTIGEISLAQASYPLVVVVHGNSDVGNSYAGYDYLLEHLAKNGFMTASIHLEVDQIITDRARVLHRHLQILFNLLGPHVANNIGIMGHSRGGEAVVKAAALNHVEAWGYNINAVISLAPTNLMNVPLVGAWAKPFLIIYGSLDGDVAGIDNTGFELYDRAGGSKKSMMFVYRSCHGRYNKLWGDADFTLGKLTPTDIARVLSVDSHQKIAMGYMSAFFRQHLRAETQYEGLFRGEWVPAAVQASDANMKIYPQYEDTMARTVDNFEGVHTATTWQTSTIGGTVTQAGLFIPDEANLRSIDPQSPHHTAGLRILWNAVTDSLQFSIPAGQRDVSAFAAVSFRITQRLAASNPEGQPQDLRLTLTDSGGKSRAIRVSKLAEIPYPDVRGIGSLTKSALRTMRIPLSAYTIKCLGVDSVNLADVVSLTFEFAEVLTGHIEIDSIQFTN